jgi:hypothetical protein
LKKIVLFPVIAFTNSSIGKELTQFLQGFVAGGQFGSDVCTIDFNNDSFTDLVVSVPASDEGGISPGKVYKYLISFLYNGEADLSYP